MIHYDDVVIGAGQAGVPLATKLASTGRKVALVEQRALGGTCVNDGCIPSKAMVASARALHVAREVARWGGVLEGKVRADLSAIVGRKRELVKASQQGLAQWIKTEKSLTLHTGRAHFTGSHRVQVGDVTLEAERFFLNTGGRAVLPTIPGLAEVALTNTSIMELETLPSHLVVLGGGPVAVEFAQMFRRFGSRVTVLQKAARLLPREDEDVVKVVSEAFAREGIAVQTEVEVRRVEQRGGTVRLELANGSIVEGSHLLCAVGRQPNSDSLGLEHAGVKVDAKGYVTVDDRLQTSAAHVYALGDVNGRGAHTHEAYNDYEILISNLLPEGERRSLVGRVPITCTYVDPPIGRVGLTEAEAKKRSNTVRRGVRPMTRVNRARAKGETEGFIKVLVDGDELLGAVIVGVEGDEAIHALAAAMHAKTPASSLAKAMFAHPTVSELIPTTLQSLEPLS